MSYNDYDLRDKYPTRRRHHSPAYSDLSVGSPEYSPTRDAGAVHVAHKHYESPDRRGRVEVYEENRYRPRTRDYHYEERRSRSRPRSEVYDYDRDRSHHSHGHGHHRHHRHTQSTSKRRHSTSGPNWGQAAVAAASAGIIEAGLARHDRDRTARVVTAAAGAGAIDAVAGKHGEKPSRTWENVVGSTVGGLVVDRMAHGSGRRR
ncbi:hypothetical protein CNYM01_00430 [Colletotrichum nymphaeae SA-01]|uniref:Uncharacterized protein n=1 Tax=Colletotrichum nymphaeae SA-01 TaxID=1460502 RepID=A0A135TVD9_9PEZI|nr:hypothetical protein CNYM01_00430 [Colletotrichum nymphaeae SA-01]